MKIRNAIIITDANSELSMTLAEQTNVTGNVIFTRENLPDDLVIILDHVTGSTITGNSIVE